MTTLDSSPSTTAIHEAAHCAVALHCGVVPRRVIATEERAQVHLPPRIPPQSAAVIACAGCSAMGILLGDTDAHLSDADAAYLIRAADELKADPDALFRWAIARSNYIVRQQEDHIQSLAVYLRVHPDLQRQGIIEACHKLGIPHDTPDERRQRALAMTPQEFLQSDLRHEFRLSATVEQGAC